MKIPRKKKNKDFYVICDNIRSLENIGSIFRTADALGVSKIFLCGISGIPPNHKISKTALGAEIFVPFEYHKQTWRVIDRLKKDHVHVIALEQGKGAISYKNFKPVFPLALIIGNEVRGISSGIVKKAEKVVYLPMRGKKESLNVAVAFGIMGYHIINQ